MLLFALCLVEPARLRCEPDMVGFDIVQARVRVDFIEATQVGLPEL